MAKQATLMKKTRARYSDAYREEALALADRVGAAAAARELGLQTSQRYQWRGKTGKTHKKPLYDGLRSALPVGA